MVTIGGIENPDGGLWTRLSFIPYVPILDITSDPAMPVDIDALKGKIYTVGFQYDPVMYAPLYWGNPIALLNALAAFETVHGYYLTPNGNGPNDPIAYGYTEAELADQLNCDDAPRELPQGQVRQHVLHDPRQEPADRGPGHVARAQRV